MLAQTTELEAVNILLSTIGESPVNSLGTPDSPQEALIAHTVLKEVSKDVQSDGWNFNIQRQFKLVPDNDGHITVPNNCVHITVVPPTPFTRASLRGLKLWNVLDNSYEFKAPVTVDMIVLLEFSELPQQARRYIIAKASRLFQQRFVGSQTLDAYTREEEAKAKADLLQYDIKEGNPNMLSDSHMIQGMLYRC